MHYAKKTINTWIYVSKIYLNYDANLRSNEVRDGKILMIEYSEIEFNQIYLTMTNSMPVFYRNNSN